jgi:predicted nucleic acid-binding protein
MGSLTCLTDPAALVVADASVIISLNATGCAAEIVRALPNRLAVVDIVAAELESGRPRGRQDADRLNDLVAAGLLDIVTLGDAAEQHFESLVVGPAAETLDDGEAATIAYALAHGALPLIDERKANRICGERFVSLRMGCTVDIFTHPNLLHALGQERLADAVANALQVARMRVLSHHVEWVVGLIGPERAAQCASMARSLRQSDENPRKSQA